MPTRAPTLLLVTVVSAVALGGCGSGASEPRADGRTAAAAPRSAGNAPTQPLPAASVPQAVPAAAPPAAADFAEDLGKTARVDIVSWVDHRTPPADAKAKGLHVDVAVAEFVPAASPDSRGDGGDDGGAPGMRATVRLRHDDGTDVGEALTWSKETGGARHPEGWPAVFRHGTETCMYFAAPLGTAYYVWLTADLSDRRHVRWTAKGQYVACTK